MDFQRVLDERSADFAQALSEVGFSQDEARRFLAEAGPALVQSYEWCRTMGSWRASGPHDLASHVLSGIPGRSLAARAGLPTEKTWTGLREFVPAVLEASGPEVREGFRTPRADDVARLDVGFGLTLERLGTGPNPPLVSGDRKAGSAHPIFGRLLSQE